jgi:hypothetical protein
MPSSECTAECSKRWGFVCLMNNPSITQMGVFRPVFKDRSRAGPRPVMADTLGDERWQHAGTRHQLLSNVGGPGGRLAVRPGPGCGEG